MPLEKLTMSHFGTGRGIRANAEYVRFLRTLKPGDGGRATVAQENATRQTIKNRLKKASDEAGVKIKFRRSPNDTVEFEVMPRQ